MNPTTENLIALGVGYKFDGKKTVFNLGELLEVFKGAKFHKEDVSEIEGNDYIEISNVDFSNAEFVQPKEKEEKKEEKKESLDKDQYPKEGTLVLSETVAPEEVKKEEVKPETVVDPKKKPATKKK